MWSWLRLLLVMRVKTIVDECTQQRRWLYTTDTLALFLPQQQIVNNSKWSATATAGGQLPPPAPTHLPASQPQRYIPLINIPAYIPVASCYADVQSILEGPSGIQMTYTSRVWRYLLLVKCRLRSRFSKSTHWAYLVGSVTCGIIIWHFRNNMKSN